MGINLTHNRVVQLDGDIQIGNAGVAGHGNGGTNQPIGGADGHRDIGAGIGGAVHAFISGGENADAEMIRGGGATHGRRSGIYKGVIGSCVLHRQEEGFGEGVGHTACGSIIDDQNLVIGIAKEGEAKTAVPLHIIPLGVKVKAQEDGIARIGREAVPILFGGQSGVACP